MSVSCAYLPHNHIVPNLRLLYMSTEVVNRARRKETLGIFCSYPPPVPTLAPKICCIVLWLREGLTDSRTLIELLVVKQATCEDIPIILYMPLLLF